MRQGGKNITDSTSKSYSTSKTHSIQQSHRRKNSLAVNYLDI